jgi:hypothetical protein
MVRIDDWEQALADYLLAQREAVFAWGRMDCVLFAAGAVAAMTGADPAADLRGKYRSQAGAGRLLKQLGFANLAVAVDSVLVPVAPAAAHRGDVVMLDGNLGLCTGRTALFLPEEGGEPGLAVRATLQCERAWRVPYATAGA